MQQAIDILEKIRQEIDRNKTQKFLQGNMSQNKFEMEKTKTRGDIFIDDICLGDTIYECDYGRCIETRVITQPTLIDGYWSWKAINVDTGKEIDYGSTAGNEHSAYGLKLYSYEAYKSVSRF